MNSPDAVTAYGCVLAQGLSQGRLRGARLALGERAQFITDLRQVFIPWPIPPEVTAVDNGLAACLALQASPTKATVADAAVDAAVDALTARQMSALRLAEGAAAMAWVCDHWPGLAGTITHLAPLIQPSRWDSVTAAQLMREALETEAESPGRRPFAVPVAFGRLPVGPPHRGLRRLVSSKAASRLPFSLERVLRRLNALSIPLGGSGGEQPPDSGAPTMTELDVVIGGRGVSAGIPYPEWNEIVGDYRHDHVTVREQRLRVVPRGVGTSGRSLEVWFNQPLERYWRGRLEDGPDVDIDAIVDARIDTICGHPPSDHLYRERLRAERDVACAVLIDSSGSAAKAGLLDHELACADALVDAMSRAGERHAVFSFWGDTRHFVAVDLLRDFDDPDNAGRPSDARLRPRGYTRLGAALRHVTSRLLRQGSSRNVLIALTDGVPCDEGYEGGYAYADLAKAIHEADEAGVAVMLLGVGAIDDDDPLLTYLPDHICRVPDLEHLAPALGEIHRRLVER